MTESAATMASQPPEVRLAKADRRRPAQAGRSFSTETAWRGTRVTQTGRAGSVVVFIASGEGPQTLVRCYLR